MASTTSLIRTPSSTGNRKTFTFSAWFKRVVTGDIGNLFSQYAGSGSSTTSTHFRVRFNTNDTINVAAGSTDILTTNRVFRDVNGWFHLVLAVDTTQGTAADRVKLYINGTQETSFSSTSYPSQNHDYAVNYSGYPMRIGADDSDGNGPYGFFDGLMSHVHFVDGTAYAASTFGSTDATTGEWKINTAPTLTMGTNGFTILKDGNTITDQSANSNNFTLVGGTLSNTEDCPSNVFPVLNQLNPQASGYTFDGRGSLSVTGNTGDAWRTMYATFGARTGKYYWEQKITNFTGVDPHYIGIVSDDQMSNSNIDQATTSRGYFYTKTGAKRNNNSQTSYGDSWTTNDIVGVALDLDNSKVFFSKNGVFQNSGDPANGTNPAFTITSGYTYIPATSTYYNLNRYDMNFGNGSFGTSAISSEGTNASNIGKFEYDVPTGFTALSTKGLNE